MKSFENFPDGLLGIEKAMMNSVHASGWGRLPRLGSIRPIAVCTLLMISLGACGGGGPQVTRPFESEATSQDVGALVRLGDGLRERGELKTAIAMYQRAAAGSNDAKELVLLGRALSEFGAYDQAAGSFRRALSREPDHPDALLGLGTSYLVLGEIDKGIQHLEQLVDQGDGVEPIRFAALGAALDMAGRHEQAVATYTAGLDEVPGDLDLRSNLALSYALYDRHVEAIEMMIEVTDSLDVRRSHNRNLVLVLALAGQDRDAVGTGRRLLGDEETQDVLAQAASLRRLPGGADRARALGVL